MTDRLTASEITYFESIKNNCNVVFDVGSHHDSIFLDYEKVVHYFEPLEQTFEKLINIKNKNLKSFYNNFGLGDEERNLNFYSHGAFFDRSKSNTHGTILGQLPIKRADKYCNENNITNIDFIKIDVEGYELNVLKGFGDILENTKYIQFEYGCGLDDAGFKLIDIVVYLKKFGFDDFCFIRDSGLENINSFVDTWEWSNICCYNKNLIK